MWQQCADEPSGYEFAVRAELSRLIYLLSCTLTQFDTPIPNKDQIMNERVKQMLQFIQAHYMEPITLGQLSQLVHISTSECLRCFHRVIGISPVKFIKQFRIQQAADLLLHSALPVGEVGAACGFEDSSYFIRSFREAKGMTPLEYRNAS